MPSSAARSQGPAIRGFQMDSISLGSLASSVNLFRGDVTLTQTLFTMPGRTEEQGLDVSVSLSYASNVGRQARTWNRDAPTGVAGLGFTLPLTCIELDDGGSPAPGSWRYSYSDGGEAATLVAEPSTPFLFSMAAGLADGLAEGQAVPAAIVQQFAGNGIALSPGSVTTQAADGTWAVTDDANRQLFTLAPADGALQAFDGGVSFQLESYAFWKILYYPRYERWIVVSEDGLVHSFGGLEGGAGSTGNSIAWAVRWTTADGEPLWSGSSTAVERQARYARAWYLESISDLWGDRVRYAYNEAPEAGGGLLDGCEQAVGAGGCAYTKAVYLTSITDVFGRRADFSYAGKLWSDAAPDDPREYADPHKDRPDTTPNAFQDRYETLYLAGIGVSDAAGSPLFSIGLVYQPSPGAAGRASEVANITDAQGRLRGDTCKRFLTAIIMRNAEGRALPGLQFDYYLDPSEPEGTDAAPGASLGALRSVTYPSGGVATYAYSRQSVPVCARDYRVVPPADAGRTYGGVPRCWFGPDYAVTTWYDQAHGTLAMQVFSWMGRWQPWQPADGPMIFSDAAGLDLATLDVAAGSDHFAVSFTAQAGTQLYLYRKSVGRPGQWDPATVGGMTTGANRPTLATAMRGATVAAGTDFLLFVQMNPAAGSFVIDRLNWNWVRRAWDHDSSRSTNFLYVAAGADYYLTLDAATGAAVLHHLANRLDWKTGPTTLTLSGFPVHASGDVVLAAGSSLVAVSHATQASQSQIVYAVTLLQWDGAYRLQADPARFSFTDPQESSHTYRTDWTPTIIDNALVAVAGHLMRFDGTAWRSNSGLVPAPQSGWQPRFAYGPDCGLLIAAYPGGTLAPKARILAFDPETDCTAWTRAATTPKQALAGTSSHAAILNWPSAGPADYLCLGQYLYFRGTASNWQTVLAGDPLADLQAEVAAIVGPCQLNSQSVVDEAPGFLSYAVYPDGSATTSATAALLLLNGAVAGKPCVWDDQRMPLPGDAGVSGPGRVPGGPGAFFTYPDTAASFDEAPSFTLHRYAGDRVTGDIVHYAVTRLTLSDGFGGLWSTLYRPDTASAACDPSGEVVKYYRTLVYPGTDTTGSPAYGWMEATYVNGMTGADGVMPWQMMDGLQQRQAAYDGAGILLSSVEYDWEVLTTRASDPDPAVSSTLNLYGGFVVRTAVTTVRDGVSGTITTLYVPDGHRDSFSGQPVGTATSVWDGAGVEQVVSTGTRYGYDVSPVFRALNLLNAAVQQTKTSRPAGSDAATLTSAQATVYTAWTSGRSAGTNVAVTVPAEGAQFAWTGPMPGDFPFKGLEPVRATTGWAPTGFVDGRDPNGLVVTSALPDGVVQSTLYDPATALPLVKFTNASLTARQCAYWNAALGDTNGGFVARGASVVASDAHFGDSCLELPGGGTAGVTAALAPLPGAGTYLLGFWYKTAADFVPGDGTGWTATTTAGSPQILAFAATGGRWVYRTMGITVAAGTPSLEVAATNAGVAPVWLDTLFVMPLQADIEATVYDGRYDLTLATMDVTGRIERTIYDSMQQQIASVGPCEVTERLSQSFLSRMGNAAGIFDAGSPNASVEVAAAGGGWTERFRADGDWTTRWTATGAWTAAGGALSFPEGGTLSWNGWPDGAPATAALQFELLAKSPGAVSVAFGNGWSLCWTPGAGYALSGPGGAVAPVPGTLPAGPAADWLLVLGCGQVLFFGDGQLLFSAAQAPGGTSAFTLGFGAGPAAIRALSLVAGPRVQIVYSDAAGRSRQTQKLLGDPAAGSSDAQVTATLYDALNRKVAITKAAPASFGKDAGLPLLAYRPRFVDAAAFCVATEDSWRMTGEVAEFYAGQTDGPFVRSDDGGYPYDGTRFPAGLTKRPAERGEPGLDLSIHDVASTRPGDRKTTQFSYGSNDAQDFAEAAGDGDPAKAALPPGRYFRKSMTTPAKSTSVSLIGLSGNQVRVSLAGRDGADRACSAGLSASADSGADTGFDASIALPNHFAGAGGFLSSTLEDPLGRLVRRDGPSTGRTFYVYDVAGRLRFVQPPLDPGESWFVYHRYDVLGRLIEQGTVPQAWNPDMMQARANDPTWPNSYVDYQVWQSIAYDGDGSEPTLIGQKWIVTTQAPGMGTGSDDTQAVVTETYAYDPSGRVAAVAQSAGAAEGTVTYAYNALDEVVRVGYPAGSPLGAAVYTLDDVGRVVAIGSGAGATDDIAAFTYTWEGDVAAMVRNRGTLETVTNYNSPGWAVSLTTTAGDATLLSLDYAYDSDGSVLQRTLGRAGSAAVTSTYAYDGQRRLTAATAADPSGTPRPGNEAILRYDANGNILEAVQDGATFAYTLAAGSDRLASALLGGTEAAFGYTADGWLHTGDALAVAHSPAFQLTTAVTRRGTTVLYGYGGNGQRVLRRVGAAIEVCYSGAGKVPLLTMTGDGAVATVAGPGGTVAVVTGEGRFFPLADLQGTVWGLADEANGLAAAFDYGAFGTPLGKTGPAAAAGYTYLGCRFDPDAELYDFGSRLYDPALRRFLSPDSANQYPSPYVFVGNDPLGLVDRDGNIAAWAQALIATATVIVTAALTIATDGAAAALFGVEGAVDGGDAAAETAEVVGKTLSKKGMVAAKTAKTAISGACTSAVKYDVKNGQNFTAKGFFEAMGIGAASGAVRGALGGVLDLPAFRPGKSGSTGTKVGKYAARYAAKGVASAIGSEVSVMLTNAEHHQPWSQGMARTAVTGILSGAAFAAFGDATAARSAGKQRAKVHPEGGKVEPEAPGKSMKKVKIGLAGTAVTLVGTYAWARLCDAKQQEKEQQQAAGG